MKFCFRGVSIFRQLQWVDNTLRNATIRKEAPCCSSVFRRYMSFKKCDKPPSKAKQHKLTVSAQGRSAEKANTCPVFTSRRAAIRSLKYCVLPKVLHSLKTSSVKRKRRFEKRQGAWLSQRLSYFERYRRGEETIMNPSLSVRPRKPTYSGVFRKPTWHEKWQWRCRLLARWKKGIAKSLPATPRKKENLPEDNPNVLEADTLTAVQLVKRGERLKHDWDVFREPSRSVIREHWSVLLEHYHNLWVEVVTKPSYLQRVLRLFKEMIVHKVIPYSHLKALSLLSPHSKLLLIATQSPDFFYCVLATKLYEPRIAQLILSRIAHGDMCCNDAALWVLQLRYCDRCFPLQPFQLKLFSK